MYGLSEVELASHEVHASRCAYHTRPSMYTMCQVKPAFLVVWSRVELAAHEVHVPLHVVHQEPNRSARSVYVCAVSGTSQSVAKKSPDW